jgi:histidinol-phosphate aminotransferase
MPLVPENIAALVAYQPGRRVQEVMRAYGLTRVIKLASNENPLGPSPRAIAAAREALASAHRYPDAGALDLREVLAARFGVRVANVIIGSGSEGILSAIMRTFLLADDEIVTAAGTFIGFQVMARASGRLVHWVPMADHRYDLDAMARVLNRHTKIVYLANPDNPTGSYFTTAEFDAFMSRVPPRALVILDEAYFEFAHDHPDYPDSMHYRYDNVITLRTFSKAQGLAGLRVGYGFAHDVLITNLHKVRLPFEPACPAQAAALAALEDEEHLARTVALAREGRAYLEGELAALGLTVLPSVGNFLCLMLPDAGAAAALTEGLLARGVIVRPLAAFGWPAGVRVTVGLPDENEYLVARLRELRPGA